MFVRKCLGLLLLLTLLIALHPHPPAAAQSSSLAWAFYAQTVYSSPDLAATIVGVFSPDSVIALEARSADASWVLGETTDRSVRGWVQTSRLQYAKDFNVAGLLVSDETMFIPPASFSAAKVAAIDLSAYPVVPVSLGRAREIFERGQMMGRDPHAMSKIGDCISASGDFLSPFGWQKYNLGANGQLQSVIAQFSASLAYDSLATYDGLVTHAALDPAFANPGACLTGESPLRCELRVHQASVAVIMFGAQDLLFTPAENFDRNLRQIVHETIQSGVVPILSTFPANLGMWDASVEYNQIVVQIALDYNVPLLNLWRALDAMPNHGVGDDGRHLSHPITTSGDLSGDNLRRGYPLRNLVTLQALDTVWQGAMY